MVEERLWVKLEYPDVMKDTYMISNLGEIKKIDIDKVIDLYHANNGVEYALLFVDPDARRRNCTKYPKPKKLFRLELLVAVTFVERDMSLVDKPLDVMHINGDSRDCSATNLKWVEDVEEWRDIKSKGVIPNAYQVSSYGRIRNTANSEVLNTRYGGDGYRLISLKLTERTAAGYDWKPFRINRLVAETWYGEHPGKDVNHIDSDHCNDHWKNVEFTTRSENLRHAVAAGNVSALPDDVLQDIFEDLKKTNSPTETYRNMCEIHPILRKYSIDNVQAVKRGFYNHRLGLPDDFRLAPCRQTITVEEIDLIRDKLIEFNGSVSQAFKSIDTEEHPRIKFDTVKDVKRRRSAYEKSNKYTTDDFERIRLMSPRGND